MINEKYKQRLGPFHTKTGAFQLFAAIVTVIQNARLASLGAKCIRASYTRAQMKFEGGSFPVMSGSHRAAGVKSLI